MKTPALALFLLLLSQAVFSSVLWTYDSKQTVISTLAALESIIIGTEEGGVIAISATTGIKAWEYNAESSIIDMAKSADRIALLLKNGKIVMLDNSGRKMIEAGLDKGGFVDQTVYGLAATENGVLATTDRGIVQVNSFGNMSWPYAENATFTRPTITSGIMAVGADDELLVFKLPQKKPAYKIQIGNVWKSAPVIKGSNAYIGTSENKVYSLDVQTGSITWSAVTGGWVDGTGAIDGPNLYIGSNDGKLYALNLVTGVSVWSSTTRGAVDTTPVFGTISGKDVVLIGSQDGNTYAFDRTDGTIIWSWEGRSGITEIYYANGIVYAIGIDGKVYAHSLDQACTITMPSQSAETDRKEMRLEGYAFPESSEVQISINSEPWETVSEGGAWKHIIQPEELREGSNLISCRAVSGGKEQKEVSIIQLIKRSNLPLGKFVINYPIQVNVGEQINITVYDGDTFELVEGYEIKTDSGILLGNENGRTNTSYEEPGQKELIIAKKGFSDARISVSIIKPGDFSSIIPYAAAGLVVLAVVGYMVLKKFRKPKKEEEF